MGNAALQVPEQNFKWRSAPLLQCRAVRPGERWIFSAGFNVRPDLKETSRIDCELADIRHISLAGGRVAILSHQGDFGDGTALRLDFVARYLAAYLGQPVTYVPDCVGDAAIAKSRSMRDGEVAVFGNTRHHDGEQTNNLQLARAFSKLGEFVAVAGFSKAHRAHASNVGILHFRPGYLASSVLSQIHQLSPWTERRPEQFSVAVLGGRKEEKLKIALCGFGKIYDLIIPGGVVLNCILKVLGYDVGGSYLGENETANLESAQKALREAKADIFVPSQVIIAAKNGGFPQGGKLIDIRDGVDQEDAIVDFVLDRQVSMALRRLVKFRGRMIIAGTPARYREGFHTACEPILTAARALGNRAILLGGDTMADLPFDGNKSVGGGSALQYICDGDLPILAALVDQSCHKEIRA
ncbi:MAG TPA: phosphoglycerate kinase [Bradyrhizobium sp.]|jgi:phosphoglycerate kinase|nr:phosphoglycerate kinase [Bradyrhizobium sp.]